MIKYLHFTIYQNTSYYKCIWQQRRRFYYIGITKHLTKSLSAIVALEMRGCLYVNFLTAAECRIFLLKLWPPKQNRIFKKIWLRPNHTASGRPLTITEDDESNCVNLSFNSSCFLTNIGVLG